MNRYFICQLASAKSYLPRQNLDPRNWQSPSHVCPINVLLCLFIYLSSYPSSHPRTGVLLGRSCFWNPRGDRLFAKQLLGNVCAVTDEHGVVVFESQLFSDGINATVLWLGIYRLGLKSLLSEQYHLSLSLPGE